MKNNKFTVNGKEYVAKEIDLAEILEFEDYGLNLTTMQTKPFNTAVAYFGICAGLDKERAVAEFREHMIHGGSPEDVYNALGTQLENSDFFRAIQENAEKETATSESKKK